MNKLYLISGLGADYRLFKNFNPEGYEIVHVHWIEPEQDDSLTTYATKLIARYQIADGEMVGGVSLGGMLTIEIAKQVKLDKAILISSIKSIDEAPGYFSLFRKFPIIKLSRPNG